MSFQDILQKSDPGRGNILSGYFNLGFRTNRNSTIGQETKNYTGFRFARPLALLFAGRGPQADAGESRQQNYF